MRSSRSRKAPPSGLLLAEFANVRSNLLSVLSASITRYAPTTYPLHLHAFLVLVVYIPPDQVGKAHDIGIVIMNADLVKEIVKMQVTFHADADRHPGEGVSIPMIMHLLPVEFGDPGQVDVQVSISGQPADDLSFWLAPVPEPGAGVEDSGTQ